MAIVNRDLDASQKRQEVDVNLGSLATGLTRMLWVAPYPCTLQSGWIAAQGVSNAMQLDFNIQRGVTAIAIGISNFILQNVGTSGALGMSMLAASGSTLLNLVQGDVLFVHSSVSNGNAVDLCIQLVVSKTQDILSFNNV